MSLSKEGWAAEVYEKDNTRQFFILIQLGEK